ncbi:nitrite/sulfite reductase domain-containing protein [Selenihalanaerobacter shriftii]|uniref:Nitrite/Sulfite reductase ferredoxin-like half domain-containing protein n=1 Tax=Selenihalanaerobacter shriftii TaxID=142842 RepID=A0A1T4LTD7_9FIRM|nr:NAD(P)/FAD-dependent oxidoreductase [Selenihalanaerobacter shriftii]SJZ57917.1 Nitrite/Sulfite reductase ferredoxin-like half domain-containing protein [Selenihalanaerobacter shriftii]
MDKTGQGTKKDILAKGAILQRDGSYAIAPHAPGGIMEPDDLIKIGEVAKKYNCEVVKATSSQRIAIVGLEESDIDAAWQDLGMDPGYAIGICVRSIKICPGTTFCKRGQQDSVGIGLKLDEKYHGIDMPGKFKIGVSGCPNKCMDTEFRDIGLMGTAKGFTIYVGGRGGVKARLGDVLISNQPEEETLQIIDNIINYFKDTGEERERLGEFIDRVSFDKFKNKVLS